MLALSPIGERMVATARYSVSQPLAAEVVAVIQETKPQAEVVGLVVVDLAGGFLILEGKPGARAHQVKAMLEVRGLDQMQDHLMVVVVEAQLQAGSFVARGSRGSGKMYTSSASSTLTGAARMRS